MLITVSTVTIWPSTEWQVSAPCTPRISRVSVRRAQREPNAARETWFGKKKSRRNCGIGYILAQAGAGEYKLRRGLGKTKKKRQNMKTSGRFHGDGEEKGRARAPHICTAQLILVACVRRPSCGAHTGEEGKHWLICFQQILPLTHIPNVSAAVLHAFTLKHNILLLLLYY